MKQNELSLEFSQTHISYKQRLGRFIEEMEKEIIHPDYR